MTGNPQCSLRRPRPPGSGSPLAVWLTTFLCAVTWLPLSSWAGPPVASITTSDPTTLALGAELFRTHCTPCHGARAAGEFPESPQGGLNSAVGQLAPALNGSGHAWHHPPAYFFQLIRNGTELNNSRMAGWGGRLTDQDIFAIIAFFQSLWPKDILDGYRHRYLEQVWD